MYYMTNHRSLNIQNKNRNSYELIRNDYSHIIFGLNVELVAVSCLQCGITRVIALAYYGRVASACRPRDSRVLAALIAFRNEGLAALIFRQDWHCRYEWRACNFVCGAKSRCWFLPVRFDLNFNVFFFYV